MSNGDSKSSNPLKGLRRPSPPVNPRLVNPLEEAYEAANPLEEAYEAAKDARDIMRDEQRRRGQLKSYTGEDEDTARHEVHVTVNVPQPAPSSPDVQVDTTVEVHGVKVTGLPKWLVSTLVAGVAVVVALGTAVVAWLAGKH